MKLHFFIRGAAILFALVMITHTIAETMESSAESKIIQIELPELGQTLATRNRGEDKPVLVTAALPKDYCNRTRGQELIIDIISVLVTLFAKSFGLFRGV